MIVEILDIPKSSDNNLAALLILETVFHLGEQQNSGQFKNFILEKDLTAKFEAIQGTDDEKVYELWTKIVDTFFTNESY